MSLCHGRLLLSGYVPQYLYERAAIDTSLPLQELKRRSHINAAAHQADNAPDLSQRQGQVTNAPETGIPLRRSAQFFSMIFCAAFRIH
jgi:hypothetical protein